MYCWKCGKEIKDGAVFCRYCGAEQEDATPTREDYHPGILVEPTQKTTPSQEQKESESDKDKKKEEGYGWVFWVLALIAISIYNIYCMKTGDSYMTFWGIPIQYVFIPGGILALYLGLHDDDNEKKE